MGLLGAGKGDKGLAKEAVLGVGLVVVLILGIQTFGSSSASGGAVASPGLAPEKVAVALEELDRTAQRVKVLETDLRSLDSTVTGLRSEVKKLRGDMAAKAADVHAAPGVDSSVPLSQRQDIRHEEGVQSGAQSSKGHSWTNPETKDTYMKMYNEYHRLRSGHNSCHGCRYLSSVFKTFPRFNKVFDAGCGTGFLVRELLRAGKEAYGVEAASLPLETYAADLLANETVFVRPLHTTPFKDEYFDFVLSTEVFEHVPMADVDRSIQELYRVAKPGAKAFVTIGMGTSRFDTVEGRKKSDVAGYDMSFKFHETVQTRKWWLDTFCQLGWYEDFAAYKQMVALMIKAGYPQTIPPRGWFALTKAPVGSRQCTCTLPEGRKASVWCGAGRNNQKQPYQLDEQ